MKFSLSWLQDHFATSLDLQGILDLMLQCGLEVEELIDPAASLNEFTVCKVLEAEQHPDADKLRVCKVETVDGIKQIVCGAPNARAGMTAIYAPLGAYIPGLDFSLDKKPRKIRGVESYGMMCSAKELEAGEDHDGIADLDASWKLGTPAADALGANDPVIDFEVTPNRPDWLGVMGIARDLAAAGGGRLISQATKPVNGFGACPTKVTIEPGSGCTQFAMVLVKGVKNGPSPDWLQQRLKSIGITPKNLLVDVTNYVSFDRARPLHVFDADAVQGDMIVQLGKDGDKLDGLDGKAYDLGPEMCVIADDAGVISLAGVMGGERTGVTEDTVNVLIESAWFEPLRTARTGRTTGIISDARYRFERGVDPKSTMAGIEQAVELITEYAGGNPSEVSFVGERASEAEPFTFYPADVERLTGLQVKPAAMRKYIKDLGFTFEDTGDAWYITPASWRFDMAQSADIVEEIARLIGFDALPITSLPTPEGGVREITTLEQSRIRTARRAMASRGFLETVTWSFMSVQEAKMFGGGEAPLKVANPVAAELNQMRPSVLANLAKAIQRGADRGEPGLRLFEAGPIYLGDGPDDQYETVTALVSPKDPRDWSGKNAVYDAYSAKADLFALLEALGQPADRFQISAPTAPYFHPGQGAALKMGPKVTVGHFGTLHPGVLKKLDVDGPLYGFELVLGRLPAGRKKAAKTKAILETTSLLPVKKDLAFVVDETVPADKLVRAAKGADKAMISEISVFDVYQGKGMEEGKKSLAIEVTVQPKDKTLTDEQIDSVMKKVIAAVSKAVGGELRG